MRYSSISRLSLELTTSPHDNTAPTARVDALTSHHLGCGVPRVGPVRTPTVPPCLPLYSRAYYDKEAVGDSTTMRNTDKRVSSTHVTLDMAVERHTTNW